MPPSEQQSGEVSYLRLLLAAPIALASSVLLANVIVLWRIAEFVAGDSL